MQLQIRHIENPNGGCPQCEVLCDGKHGKPVNLTPPVEVILKAHNINLQEALQWYLEEYLNMPIIGYKTRSEAVEDALA
jgi:hypothetical protein